MGCYTSKSEKSAASNNNNNANTAGGGGGVGGNNAAEKYAADDLDENALKLVKRSSKAQGGTSQEGGGGDQTEEQLILVSGDLNHSSTVNLKQVPASVDTTKYERAFQKFSSILDLLGDTNFLPKQTQQYLAKLVEACKKVDRTLQGINGRPEDFRRKYVYYMFEKFQPPLCKIIAILLNDKSFNEAFPMLRENFKDVWHIFKRYEQELIELIGANNLDGLAVKRVASQDDLGSGEAAPASQAKQGGGGGAQNSQQPQQPQSQQQQKQQQQQQQKQLTSSQLADAQKSTHKQVREPENMQKSFAKTEQPQTQSLTGLPQITNAQAKDSKRE